MKSMVERVARALTEQSRFRSESCPTFEMTLAEARAAIEAMREPTDAMVDAADAAIAFHQQWRLAIDAALNEQVSG